MSLRMRGDDQRVGGQQPCESGRRERERERGAKSLSPLRSSVFAPPLAVSFYDVNIMCRLRNFGSRCGALIVSTCSLVS